MTGGPSTASGGAALPERPSWASALIRLWCLRAVPASPLGSIGTAAATLMALWCGCWIGIDRWQRQPNPEFSLEGVTLLAWYVLGVVGLAGVLTFRARPRPAFGAALVLSLGVVPVPLLLMSVLSYFVGARVFAWVCVAVGAYCLGYLLRGLHALTGRSQRLAAVAGVMFGAAFIWSSESLNAIPDFWNPREDSSSGVTEDVLAEREAALFEQEDRIDALLEPLSRDAVGPDRGAESHAYFIGFAGVGAERVFAQEIGLAARVIGDRYAVGDRHLSLVNDERDLDAAPIASVSGLAYALKGMAARMDLDRDVLFLAISSHGSPDPAIVVENSGLPLQSLTPKALAEALRDAGVLWRVIIVSACYAGGFIEALRDPQTIVIAAAAPDRTSFGCSSDSDLTYFGAAFYRDALPNAASLRAAFETAKAAIAQRESAEHETPSNPQAWFGGEMEARLPTLRP